MPVVISDAANIIKFREVVYYDSKSKAFQTNLKLELIRHGQFGMVTFQKFRRHDGVVVCLDDIGRQVYLNVGVLSFVT